MLHIFLFGAYHALWASTDKAPGIYYAVGVILMKQFMQCSSSLRARRSCQTRPIAKCSPCQDHARCPWDQNQRWACSLLRAYHHQFLVLWHVKSTLWFDETMTLSKFPLAIPHSAVSPKSLFFSTQLFCLPILQRLTDVACFVSLADLCDCIHAKYPRHRCL